MMKPWLVLATIAYRAVADTPAETKQDESSEIPREAIVLVIALLLMLLVIVTMYIKFQSRAPKTITVSKTDPVFVQTSSFHTPPPIVKVQFEKSGTEVHSRVSDLDANPMFASDTNPAPDLVVRPELEESIAEGQPEADQVESRKGSETSTDIPFRKFRLHSLSDGDLGLNPSAYEELVSPRI